MSRSKRVGIVTGIFFFAVIIIIIIIEIPWLDVKETNHAVIVGDSWHYVGNENLTDSSITSQICPAIGNAVGRPIPCPISSQPVIAEKYINNMGIPIYLASGGVGNGHSLDKVCMIIYNSQIVCMWTNSTHSEISLLNRCPVII